MKDFKIIPFIYKKAFQESKTFIFYIPIQIILIALNNLVWVIFPKLIIDCLLESDLSQHEITKKVLIILSIFIASLLLIGLVRDFIDKNLDYANHSIYTHLMKLMAVKTTEMDYEHLENKDTLVLKEKASNGIRYWGGIYMVNYSIINIFSALITIISLIGILTTFNFLYGLILLACIIINTCINNRLRKIVLYFWSKLHEFTHEYRYLNDLISDYKYAKDIRLNDMSDFLLSKNEVYKQKTYDYFLKQGKTEMKHVFGKSFVNFFRNLLIYALVGYYAYKRQITIGEFVLIISAAQSMFSSSMSMTQCIIDLKKFCRYAEPYHEYLTLKPLKVLNDLPVMKVNDYIIEFKNVSFKYPFSDNNVLKNINITIESHQKLAIVGLNGAGKTTFIKLLIRLYDPDEGEILLNGVNIKEFDLQEYYNLFSVVFQDFNIFYATIEENVAISDKDEKKFYESLKKVNLDEKIAALPNGKDSKMLKMFDMDGVELSGGESQRLVLARAIFKNGAIVILDEPTSALDPLAEYEIFHKFNEVVQDKTAIYISHRLSACRISDCIAVFKDGMIAEYGSHESLLQKEEGLYKKMWETQAQYYRSN